MKTKFKYFTLAVFAVTSLFFASASMGQTSTGSIEGTVTDQDGAVVAGATVTLADKSTGAKLTATTNDDGSYVFRALTPGTFTIKIEAPKFATATSDVVVQTGQISQANIQMKIGSASEIVQVDIGGGDTLAVDTTRQNIDGVITGRQITALPLNQRNFLDLAILQPGVTVVDGGVIDPTKTSTFRAVRVNGGSGTGTRVQIEGVDVTDETVGTTVTNISTDAVGEFNLQRNSFDLSTSLTSSGAVSIVTRNGGNQFSGSGFYFKQDDKFDARPAFAAVKPEFNRDQTGYRFGGPFIKNRLFFFSNFERFNQQDFNQFTSGDFPAFNATSTLPIKTRYATNRLDFNVTDAVRAFYVHNFNDDSSTGGNLRSPFQNINWTNLHVIGLNLLGSKWTHQIRLGYVNFNNRIASTELSGFAFPTSGGTPIQVNVGDLSIGPNSLAPQQTYQDNKQFKYDGSLVTGNHIWRFGGEYTKILLGGFANFAGPVTVIGDITTSTSTNPQAYLLADFSVGPNAGFFTARPAHNLPFGGKSNGRYAFYAGDSWKVLDNFAINAGVRWTYDTNFFSSPDVPRLPQIDVYGAGFGDAPKYPKNKFAPQIGFAWDPWSNGKTSVRGGFSIAYEANVFNNSLFDEFARITAGIGPTALGSSLVVGPTGAPIVVPGVCGGGGGVGDYSCLTGQPISTVLSQIVQINNAVQVAYGNLGSYNPNSGPSEFANTQGVTFGGQFPGNYKIPFSRQYNFGIQHEVWKSNILSVDYIVQDTHGLPLLLQDFEQRRDARTYNDAAVRARIATVIGAPANPANIQTWMNANPTRSISQLGIVNDTTFPGLTSTNLRARLAVGGRSVYSGVQVSMTGRMGRGSFGFLGGGDRPIVRGMSYTVGYALAQNKATSGVVRPEFIANTSDNLNVRSDYGPSGLDRTHNLTVSANMNLIGGFVLDQIYRFATTAPQSLFIPNNRGTSGFFTSDENGDGGAGTTPRGDLLPGTNIGDLGRKIKSWAQLNQVIANYNASHAGKITPHGQRMVAAGIITEAQLLALGAVMPTIPLVPTSNPWPFENLFTADYRLSRPIRIWKENWQLEPSFSVFNVFNQAALGQYAGLAIPNLCTGAAITANCPTGLTNRTGQVVSNFGALNYNYAASELPALTEARGLRNNRRQLQFGIRFTF